MHKCPSCGAKLEIRTLISLVGNRQRRKYKQRSGAFEQVAHTPTGRISSFVWGVIFGKPLLAQQQSNIVVESWMIPSEKERLITKLELPATEVEVEKLAQLYCDPPRGWGMGWARDTTTGKTPLSQTKHNRITDAFRRLGFLRVSRGTEENPTQYRLTRAGKRFLGHYSTGG